MTAPQWASALFGAVFALWGLAAFIRLRTSRLRAVMALIVGAFLLYAGFRPAIIEWMGPDSDALRLRWIVALLSVATLTATLEAIRVSRMRARNALFWIAVSLGLLAGSLFPPLAAAARRLTGMSFEAIVVAGLTAFVFFLLFRLCIEISDLRAKLAELARALALAEEKLRRLSAAKTDGQRSARPSDPPA